MALAAGLGAWLALAAEQESLAQAELQASWSLVAGLETWLSLAVEPGPSLVLAAEPRALQAQAVVWKAFLVQAAGLEVFQDSLVE